jgi:hypothetical protein
MDRFAAHAGGRLADEADAGIVAVIVVKAGEPLRQASPRARRKVARLHLLTRASIR